MTDCLAGLGVDVSVERRPGRGSPAPAAGWSTGPVPLARRARRHDVAVRHRGRRAGRRTGHDRRRRRRCGAGRWPRCTTRCVALGADVRAGDGAGRLPVTVHRPAAAGRTVSPARRRVQPVPHRADADRSAARRRVSRSRSTTPLVSVPYVALTAAVMAAFGVDGVEVGDDRVVVAARPLPRRGSYRSSRMPRRRATRWRWPRSPVAGSASAGLTPRVGAGRRDVRRAAGVDGLPAGRRRRRALDVSPRSGRRRCAGSTSTSRDNSDLVPTLAVVAAHRHRRRPGSAGVGFIRSKESDRLGDLAARARPSRRRGHGRATTGSRIAPPTLHGARLDTHHDHRLAMAFGVLGTAVAGIEVDRSGVVSKSWPDFWSVRDEIVRSGE